MLVNVDIVLLGIWLMWLSWLLELQCCEFFILRINFQNVLVYYSIFCLYLIMNIQIENDVRVIYYNKILGYVMRFLIGLYNLSWKIN